jgi:hypothetical protein
MGVMVSGGIVVIHVDTCSVMCFTRGESMVSCKGSILYCVSSHLDSFFCAFHHHSCSFGH